MPAIFISHSSLDQQIANDVKTALDQFGFERVFLDFDKVTGIGAGENWEKRRTVPGARAGQGHFADRLQTPR